jgi:glycosyltransferase involved in cell wall biosynthesis/RimJ/RimL family protein N-acetyltransferase
MCSVVIRPLEKYDAEISYRWRNDSDVWKHTGSRPNREITREIELQWIQKAIADESCRRFAIVCDDTYVGNVQLTSITSSSAEFHIFIGEKSFWGKGIAKQATYQILHYAKEELKLNNVFLSVKKDNISAVQAYLRTSFKISSEEVDGWIKMSSDLEILQPPMLSVFVMVYNHEKYLEKCLQGILMQKCNFNYNIVVGDDCSKDKSREILLNFQKKYPGKFKLLLNNTNIGAQGNQDLVFRNCEGKYIAMCEGDDYWTDPLKLQKQVDFLEKNEEYSICLHGVKINDVIRESERITEFSNSMELSKEKILTFNFIHTVSFVFRRKFLKMEILNNKNTFGGDRLLLLLMVEMGKLYFIKDIMATYRIHEGGISNSYKQQSVVTYNMHFIKQYIFIKNNFKSQKKVTLLKISDHYMTISLHYYHKRNIKALFYFIKAIFYRPELIFKGIKKIFSWKK